MRILRVRKRTAVVVVSVLAAFLLGAWLWLRDSPLVAVKRVAVTGVSGPDTAAIRAALRSAARNMTTLDVRDDQLRTAVAPYPVVKDLQVSAQFPHGMRIRVIEQIPVARLIGARRAIPVSGDGTLLRDMRTRGSLPVVQLSAPPGGPKLTQPDALHAVQLLGAAPYDMLAHVAQVSALPHQGLVAKLAGGPSLVFGDPSRLSAKWTAAIAVLADAGSAQAGYIDVSDPTRPAAGAGSDVPGDGKSGAPSAAASSGAGAGAAGGVGASSATASSGASAAAAGGAGRP